VDRYLSAAKQKIHEITLTDTNKAMILVRSNFKQSRFDILEVMQWGPGNPAKKRLIKLALALLPLRSKFDHTKRG